jgi:sugar phosphate isomerase/epimerase
MDWTIHSTVPFPLLLEEGTIDALAALAVGPEIYLSAETLDSLSPAAAERAAAALDRAGVKSLTFHAPFEELWAGARDEEARLLVVKRWRQALALAPLFRPRGMVVHGGYFRWIYDYTPERWLPRARETFLAACEAAEKAGTDLFLENVFDEAPDTLLALRDSVGSPRLKFCLDPGHATLFSSLPVHRWAEAFGSDMGEMHVHDNRGGRDDHLPVGEGSINFLGVIRAAVDAGGRPILTTEPHRKEHFPRGIAALRRILAEL